VTRFAPEYSERWPGGLVVADESCTPEADGTGPELTERLEIMRTRAVVRAALIGTGLPTVYQLEMSIGPRAYRADVGKAKTECAECRLRVLSRWDRGTSTIHKRSGSMTLFTQQILQALREQTALTDQILEWRVWRLLDPKPIVPLEPAPSSPIVEQFARQLASDEQHPHQRARHFVAHLLRGLRHGATRHAAIEGLLLLLHRSRELHQLPQYALALLAWSRVQHALERDVILCSIARELFDVVNARFARVRLYDCSNFSAWLTLGTAHIDSVYLKDSCLWVHNGTGTSLPLRKRVRWRLEPGVVEIPAPLPKSTQDNAATRTVSHLSGRVSGGSMATDPSRRH
jgi:hypothetical protein